MESNSIPSSGFKQALVKDFYKVEKGQWIFHTGRKFIIKSLYTITAPEEQYEIDEEWNDDDYGRRKLEALLPFIEHKKCWIEEVEKPPTKPKKEKPTNRLEIDNSLLEI